MKTAVMTDTNAGIDFALAEQLGLFVIPMPIVIDGEIYYENINISEKEFYDLQRTDASISTTLPAIGAVMEMWNHILENYDELIYIPMSSALSSSYMSSKLLAEDEYGDRVVVCDNRRISLTLKDAVLQARELSLQGKSAVDIKNFLEAEAANNVIYLAVDTLEYLKKGGRITPTVAALSMLLNVKPILSINCGKLDSFAKCRGIHKAQEKMIEAIRNDLAERFKDYDHSELSLQVAGTALDEDAVEKWRTAVQTAFPEFIVDYANLPLSIGAHVGPNTFAVALSVIKI